MLLLVLEGWQGSWFGYLPPTRPTTKNGIGIYPGKPIGSPKNTTKIKMVFGVPTPYSKYLRFPGIFWNTDRFFKVNTDSVFSRGST